MPRNLYPPTDAGLKSDSNLTVITNTSEITLPDRHQHETFSPSIETSNSRERRKSMCSSTGISKVAIEDQGISLRAKSMRTKSFSTPRKAFETLEIDDGGEERNEKKTRGQGYEEGRDGARATQQEAEGGLIFRLTKFSPLGGLSSPGTYDRDDGDQNASMDDLDDPALQDATVDRLSEGGHSNRKRLSSIASVVSGVDGGDEEYAKNTSDFYTGQLASEAVSADDFLPMFTFVLAQSALPQLVIIKELMTNLVANEETYGECGYYLATLEASLAHIEELSDQLERKGSERHPELISE